MKIQKIVLIFASGLVLLNLWGCMTAEKMNKKMSSWEGRDISNLIASWGPPDKVIDIEDSKKIYCYGSKYRDHSYKNTQSSGNTITIRFEWYRMFWADEKGIIYKWSWEGI